MRGQSELAIDLESVRVAGRRYRLETVDIVEKGKQGVGMNAAAGTVTQGVTRGKGVNVPAETLLSFRLEAPVRIKEIR